MTTIQWIRMQEFRSWPRQKRWWKCSTMLQRITGYDLFYRQGSWPHQPPVLRGVVLSITGSDIIRPPWIEWLTDRSNNIPLPQTFVGINYMKPLLCIYCILFKTCLEHVVKMEILCPGSMLANFCVMNLIHNWHTQQQHYKVCR